jgi:hypothetical protein
VPPHHRRALVVAVKAAGAFNRGACSDIIAILNVLKFGWPAGTEEEVAA